MKLYLQDVMSNNGQDSNRIIILHEIVKKKNEYFVLNVSLLA